MGSFEERVMKEFEALQAIQEKMEGIETIRTCLDDLDAKFMEQVERLDQVQTKVDLSVSSIGEIHHENVHVARVLKESPQQRNSGIERLAAEGLFAPSLGSVNRPPPPPPPPDQQFGHRSDRPQVLYTNAQHDEGSSSSRRPWMPRMEFPRFSGVGVRIWLDNCAVYFLMYNILANFKVMSASLHLSYNTAHWYQSVKFTDVCSNWESFSAAILTEFEVNEHRNCMRELMVLKQTGTVQEYRSAFNQLVYQVRLYEGMVSETLLVTRFILGLKDETRAAVEIQLPETVHSATQYALVQESLLARGKEQPHKYHKIVLPRDTRGITNKGETAGKNSFNAGDVWKARQHPPLHRWNLSPYPFPN
uniref:Uncharacterized protein n=1 Tax=Avena sativa TaxID=4498 RepID=A0ACD5T886_AVESA